VELTVEQDRLIIAADRHPRQGWKTAFARASSCGEDAVLLETGPNGFDAGEWAW
jgi:hypothetical protein